MKFSIKKDTVILFTDVDECVQPDLQMDMCRYGCINTPGSYRCAEPMELKDQPIKESLSITCLPGYEATPDGTCIGKWCNLSGRHFSFPSFGLLFRNYY